MSDRAGTAAWVGIDLGTQSVRAVALADDGATLGAATMPLTSTRSGDRHEQDPAEWWSAVCSVLREVTATVGADYSILAVAVSATSGTIVVVDDRGRPVTRGIMYDDARGAEYTNRVNVAGAQVWARLGFRMQGSWALPAIVWLRENGILTGTRTIAHQPDLITAHLAGRILPSDSSHALKSGIDLDTLEWPRDVMEALDVPLTSLPAVVQAGTVIGRVDALAAEDTGLPAGCAIVAGMTDGCAAQLAAGSLVPGSWNSVLGTTLVVKGMSLDRRPDPTGAVYAHRAPFSAGWLPGGASSTGAGAISHWLAGRDLTALTARAATLQSTAVAYPLVGRGERFPFVAPDAHAFLDGGDFSLADDVAALSAIACGVAFVERLSYDLLESCGYDTSGELSFTGGGAKNPWWNQLRCDLLERPVRIPERGEGAFGMALLAAAAMDEGTPAGERLAVAASRLLGGGRRLTPRPADELIAGYRGFLDELRRREWLPDGLYAFAVARLERSKVSPA